MHCILQKEKINILDLLDYLAPALALGQAIGRWGNFANIEAYGVETTLPWRMGIYEANKYVEVHPTFLLRIYCNIYYIYCINEKREKQKIFRRANIYLLYDVWTRKANSRRLKNR